MFRGPEAHNSFDTRIQKFKDSVERSSKKYETLNEKLIRINALNKKLSEGFSVSMHVIVDISNLLKQYTSLFDEMESLLSKIDEHSGIKTIDIEYMNAVTKKTIEQLTIDFSKQIDNVVKTYEKNGKSKEDMNQLQKLRELSTNITTVSPTPTPTPTPTNVLPTPSSGGSTRKYSLYTKSGRKKIITTKNISSGGKKKH